MCSIENFEIITKGVPSGRGGGGGEVRHLHLGKPEKMIEKSVRLVNLIKMIGKLTNNMDFIRTNLGLKSNTKQGKGKGRGEDMWTEIFRYWFVI